MKLKLSLAGLAIAGGALLLTASPASAHVGIEESEQVAGASTVLGFAVPHGCEGSATTEVAILIPESILTVTPNRNPYYDVTVETEALDEPVTGSHGEEITERDAVVTFTAREPLPDGIRDVLGISMTIPDDAAGETLYFPTVQTCEQGDTAWIQIPDDGEDPHDLDAPAPSVHVVAAAADADVAEADDDSDSSNGMAIAALALGAVSLAVSGGAVARSRK